MAFAYDKGCCCMWLDSDSSTKLLISQSIRILHTHEYNRQWKMASTALECYKNEIGKEIKFPGKRGYER
jgi:hypothetical protein